MSLLDQSLPLSWRQSIRELGIALLVLGLAVTIGVIAGALPMNLSVLVLGGLIGLPLFALAFLRLDLGILLMLIIGFLVELIRKYSAAPIGVALDGMIVIFGVSMIAGLAKTKDFSIARHPISYMVLVWMYYCGLQLVNPEPTANRLAWLYTVRSLAGLLFLYFIALYALDTLPKIKRAIKVIFGLGVLAGIYGLKQEFVGFSPQELAWLHSDEKRFELIFQWSRMRVFSFFSDPTTCGIVMSYLSAFGVVLLFGPWKKYQKVLISIGILAMLMTMGYAGSRTPIAMFPVALAFFVLLYPKKHILAIALVFFSFGTLAMMKSSSNPVIHRIQSSFKPGEDASVQVRLDNQRLIQPFIQQHPIGSGLGTTGDWGRRFNPDFWLAHFAHDSGLVRIAVEAGYIGLLIYVLFLFVILYTGIRQYFRVRDPAIKNLSLGIVVVMFALTLASYPQEAIPMLPTSLVFYVLLACQVRLSRLDEQMIEAPGR